MLLPFRNHFEAKDSQFWHILDLILFKQVKTITTHCWRRPKRTCTSSLSAPTNQTSTLFLQRGPMTAILEAEIDNESWKSPKPNLWIQQTSKLLHSCAVFYCTYRLNSVSHRYGDSVFKNVSKILKYFDSQKEESQLGTFGRNHILKLLVVVRLCTEWELYSKSRSKLSMLSIVTGFVVVPLKRSMKQSGRVKFFATIVNFNCAALWATCIKSHFNVVGPLL